MSVTGWLTSGTTPVPERMSHRRTASGVAQSAGVRATRGDGYLDEEVQEECRAVRRPSRPVSLTEHDSESRIVGASCQDE